MESIFADGCSFCSEIICSSDRISMDRHILKFFTFLVARINTTALEGASMCKTCLDKLQSAYNFKMLYVNCARETQQNIHPEIFCVCHICKEISKKSTSTSLTNLTRQSENIIDYLLEGLDLEVPEDSLICVSCQESLSNLQSVVNLLSIYDTTKVPVKVELLHVKSSTDKIKIKEEPLIKYSDILYENSTFNNNVMQNENIGTLIKKEISKEDEENIKYENFLCKNEELDLKEEKIEGSRSIEWMKKSSKRNSSKLDTQYISFDYRSNMFTCNFCEYQATRKGNLKSHLLIHKNVGESEMYMCEICEYKTKRKQNFKQHKLIHKSINEIELFECCECGYKAKHKGNLKQHMITHKNVTEIEIFKCDLCEFRTKYKPNLKKHGLIHENNNETEVLTCDACEYKTKRKYCLKLHSLKHKNIDEVKIFACDVCMYKTKRRDCLRSHMIVHKSIEEIEWFICDLCGYKAKHKGNLKKHMLSHKIVNETMTF